MATGSNSALRWVAAGAMPVALVAWLSAELSPHPLAPGSLFAIAPALLVASLSDTLRHVRVVVPAVAVLIYFLSSMSLLAGARWAWHFSAALFSLMVVLSALFWVYVWPFGTKYQGPLYTSLVAGENVVCVVLVAILFARSLGQPANRNVAIAHVALFCWLNWAAFPWLGEAL